MPRRAYHEPASCCSCCCAGCDPTPAPVPAPCYYPAPVPCYNPSPVPAPAPAPASSSTSDHLLHAIAAHLLLGSSTPAPASAPPPQPQPPPAAHHATNPYPYPQQQESKPHAYAHPPPQHQHHPQPSASDHGHLLLHSLLRRVAALESALPPPSRRAHYPNPRPHRVARQAVLEDEDDEDDEDAEAEESPPSPPRRPTRRAGPSSSARDLAARTIQAHFRRFLARRSRTLRHLKELAVLRSQSASLRGSLSGRRGRGAADPDAVSEAAMGLLFRLDAIQGGDPMIREGKRAVSRELTRILEFVDKVLLKELPMGAALEDSDDYHQGCNRPAVNRKVSFSSNGQIHELVNDGEAQNRKEADDGSDESESESEAAGSDQVKPANRNANGGKPGLAAPMPVHMETRRVVDGQRR